MRFTVTKPVEIQVSFVRIAVAVRYEDEDMPFDFPGRIGDMWSVTVDIETGKILDWPEGVKHELYMKVCDEGSYYLLDSDMEAVGQIEQDYVPHGVVPGKYGDYIEMDIRSDGTIGNWPKRLDVSDFFPED